MWSESQSCHQAGASVRGVVAAFDRPGRRINLPDAPAPRDMGQLLVIDQALRQISVHQSPVPGQLYSPALQVASSLEPVHDDAP